MKSTLRFFTFIVCTFLLLPTCVDQDFDAPPAGGEPLDITANTTIIELLALHTNDNFEEITEDLIITGSVVADDASGNYFRSIVIQDATAGIEVRINATELYNDYPIGRQLFIKCKGLFLGDYNGLPQIGGSIVDDGGQLEMQGIEEVLLEEHILKGLRDQFITPKDIALEDLDDLDINTLIRLSDVQFSSVDAGVEYADAINLFSVNRVVENCTGENIILRTSGYSDFASMITPSGNGSIIAIHTIFGSTRQMVIRNPNDVEMTADRCGITGGGDIMDIIDLRSAFNSGATTGPAGKSISGVVVSDLANGNITGRNLVVQDATGGIVLRFVSDHSFQLGEKIETVVSGAELSEFSGLLQVNNLDLSSAISLGPDTTPNPRSTTVTEVINNLESWESTLIELTDVTFSGSTTWNGNISVSDATGTIDLFTRSAASFSGGSVPVGADKIVVIVSQFNTPQILLRNLDDVEGGGMTGGPGDINETFDGVTNDEDIALNGWINVAIQGSRVWRGKEFSGEKYAQATAFNDTNPNMETWLITPELDLATPKTLRFESAQAFWSHDGLSVWISTDFDGSNVTNAAWIELSSTLAGQSDADHEWIDSGLLDLSSFSGTGYIGFKCVGNPNNGTTSYRIDNVVVE